MARAKCRLCWLPPLPGAKGITTPPIAGYYRVGVKSHLTPEERMFVLRHELGHVLAGDAEEPVRMVDRGYLTQGERLPDLFALADLVPGSYLNTLRSIKLRWPEIKADVEVQLREEWGPDWPEARVQDRAALRLRLFRECGI